MQPASNNKHASPIGFSSASCAEHNVSAVRPICREANSCSHDTFNDEDDTFRESCQTNKKGNGRYKNTRWKEPFGRVRASCHSARIQDQLGQRPVFEWRPCLARRRAVPVLYQLANPADTPEGRLYAPTCLLSMSRSSTDSTLGKRPTAATIQRDFSGAPCARRL